MTGAALQALAGQQDRMLDELRALVDCESPSAEASATAACAKVLSEIASERIGVPVQRHEAGGRTHLLWTIGKPHVLLLGHLDTVWPLGTTERWSFQVEGDRVTGPGVFDMKAGLVQMFAALSVVDDIEGVAVLVTSDEEIGSVTSRALIEDTAGGLRAVLVCEPSLDGALKTARKGVATYRIGVTGRAAHAGLEPERGVNAVLELAHLLQCAAAVSRPELGTTVTPTLIDGGTTANTVPARATGALDVRATTLAEQRRVDTELRELQPSLPGAVVEVTVDSERPPLEAALSVELFGTAKRLAEAIGIQPLSGAAVGGGSDGNYTAALGVPTLDGLGAVGAGAHAEGEWASLRGMVERGGLLAALIEHLKA